MVSQSHRFLFFVTIMLGVDYARSNLGLCMRDGSHLSNSYKTIRRTVGKRSPSFLRKMPFPLHFYLLGCVGLTSEKNDNIKSMRKTIDVNANKQKIKKRFPENSDGLRGKVLWHRRLN